MEFGFPSEAEWLSEAMSLAPQATGLLLLFERPDAHLEAMTLAKVALTAYPQAARCLLLSAACDRRRILALCLASGRNGPVTVIDPGHAAEMPLEQWDSQWIPAATVITGHVAFGLALAAHPSLLHGVDLILLDNIHMMGSPRDPDHRALLDHFRRHLESGLQCRVLGVTSRRHLGTGCDRPLPRLLQFFPQTATCKVLVLDNPRRDDTWPMDEVASRSEVRWLDGDGLWLGGDMRPRPEGWPFKHVRA